MVLLGATRYSCGIADALRAPLSHYTSQGEDRLQTSRPPPFVPRLWASPPIRSPRPAGRPESAPGHLVERSAEIGFQQADRGLDQAVDGMHYVADSTVGFPPRWKMRASQMAELASTAADQAEAVARYLRETDIRQPDRHLEGISARRRPPCSWAAHSSSASRARPRPRPPMPRVRTAAGSSERDQNAVPRNGTGISLLDLTRLPWAPTPTGEDRTVVEQGDARGSGRCSVTWVARSARWSARRSISLASRSRPRSAAWAACAVRHGVGGALIYAGLLVVLLSIVLMLIDAGLDRGPRRSWWVASLSSSVPSSSWSACSRFATTSSRRTDGRNGSRERRVRQGAGEVTIERNDDERLPAEGAADLSADGADAGSLTDEERAEAIEIRGRHRRDARGNGRDPRGAG